jgi:acyl-CoA synthetase (AMP-forming)/AMP-acid ligase II
MAAALAARGVSKGDRILVQAKNSNQLFETMFVCFRLGAIWVPTNFRLTAEEVAYLASASGATAMICGSEFPDHAGAATDTAPAWIYGLNRSVGIRPGL